MKKSNHRHDYVRHIRLIKSYYRNCYEIVNVCSICGRIKDLPFKEQLIKRDGHYIWLTDLDEIRKQFGDLPLLINN